ncbi:MAG: hypothetical protein ACRCY4_03920 [Brevinema sp.]
MSPIINAFFLTFIVLGGIFLAHIYPGGDTARALYNILPLVPVVASAVLVTCMILPQKAKAPKSSVMGCFCFVMLVFCCEITLRELLTPLILPKTEATTNPQEFLLNGHPLSKKGIFFATQTNTYILGETLRQDNTYIGRNLTVNQDDYSWHVPFFRIEDGRLFALNPRQIMGGQTNTTTGMVEFPLPISFDALYDLWGVPGPQRVSLVALARYPDAFTNRLSYPYRRAILLALARYVVSLLLLIVAVAIGWGAQGRLKFHGIQGIGSITFVLLAFPVSAMIYYSLITIANNIILRIL